MIASSAEIKGFLGITDTTYDTRISALIDPTELEIIRLANNKFLDNGIYIASSNVTFTNSTKKIAVSNVDFTATNNKFTAGWYYVYGSDQNDGYHQVSTVATTELTLVTAPVDETSGSYIVIKRCRFPQELKLLVADMIGEKLTKEGTTLGIRSESLGSHSITYEDGYSQSVMDRIKAFRQVFP